MPAKITLKLDKERELKFTMPSITALDELYQINVYEAAQYDSFPPAKIVSLIWAAQMHTKNALKRHQIAAYLPTNMAEYMAICVKVAEAIRDALKDPTPKAANE